METSSKDTAQMKSALFIDFDNIYITLENQDKQAAEKFATNPDRWLGWLERQLPTNYPGSNFSGRRILIRRCYLNPNSFSEYRPQFIRSACEVVDCPPLTAQGKTSTDIHMVMDMLDALGHDTFFDEFIIFSGDADFTPVLLKIRKHARFSAVLSVGYSSPAYRAACDQLIKENAFLEMALGINYQDEDHEIDNHARENKVDKKLLKSMADRVYETAMLPTGIPANDLPAIYKEFSGFTKSSHWLGYKSLRRLTQAVVELHKDLVILEDEDSWSVARKVFAGFLSANEKEKNLQSDTSLLGLRDQITKWLKNLVGASPTPMALNVLAQSVLRRFGDQDGGSGWLGAG
ncbi:MAG TPA: NYN domain-containing protein, partial [Anaerolineales bacterium]|nr:NYN domain-containing protein [Anaerolineales bacterium]